MVAKKQNFDDLTRDVDWQLLNLYKFIVQYFLVPKGKRKGMSPSETAVQGVLDDYLYLVAKFYLQFRGDLETEYTKNKSVPANEVQVLMQQALDKLAKEWERVYGFVVLNTKSIIKESQEFIERLAPVINAASLDMGFSSKFPVIPQFGNAYSLGFFNYSDDFSALNMPLQKIKSPWEWTIFWHELAGLKVRLLVKTQVEFEKLFQELFNEAKNHPEMFKEMASDKDKTEIDAIIDVITGMLGLSLGSELYELSDEEKKEIEDGLRDCVSKDYLVSSDSANLSLTNTRKFFQDLSPLRPTFLPILMFSFDHLYSEIMDELLGRQKALVMGELFASLKGVLTPADAQNNDVMDEFVRAMEKALALNGDFTAQKKALTEKGWSGDWLEELFEDSFSVMNFNLEFLLLFDSLLSRYPSGDQRHPPHNVRLAVALSVKLLSFKEELKEYATPPVVANWPIWNQESMGLNTVKEYKSLIRFYSEDLKADGEIVWLVARKIWDLHKLMKIPHNDTDEKKAIAKAMADYRTKKSPEWIGEWEKVANGAFDFLKELKSESANKTDQLKSGEDRIEWVKAVLDKKKIDDLLKTNSLLNPLPLGYRELLALSFYDVDYNQAPPAPLPPIYSFSFGTTTYNITSTNLDNAGTYISTNKIPGLTETKINNKYYYTSSKNLETMKTNKLIT